MTIVNLGSINIDHIYTMPHLVTAGETIAATSFQSALGGKGANQSIAIARAGGTVFHGGMINRRDEAWLKPMIDAGVDVSMVAHGDLPTGHAIVAVDDGTGENQIILSPSSNNAVPDHIGAWLLEKGGVGDWALAQNETNQTASFLKDAKAKGLSICYSAAPFVADITADLLPLVDLLIVNEGEYADLVSHLGRVDLGINHLIVTKGSKGATYYGEGEPFECPAAKVEAVDTTGAGDTYLGYVLAGLDGGMTMQDAMERAALAAAIQVTRLGASEAIPTADEVADTSF